MATQKIFRSKIRSTMWGAGCPCRDNRFADIYVACIKAGLSDAAAFNLARQAYYVAQGYTWKFEPGYNGDNWLPRQLHRIVQGENAKRNPHHKDAEDLAAEREGRPSRWGTEEFHRSAREAATA